MIDRAIVKFIDNGRIPESVYLEAVSKIEGVALHPEIGDDKAPCAGNGGSISKYGNAVSADFRVQPFGPGPFLRTPALLIAHLARLNYALRALDCAKMTPGETPSIFATASKYVLQIIKHRP